VVKSVVLPREMCRPPVPGVVAAWGEDAPLGVDGRVKAVDGHYRSKCDVRWRVVGRRRDR